VAQFSSRPVEGVDDLLRALVPAFTRAHRFLGGPSEAAEVEHQLLSSPRIRYGPLATIVHPGPRFSLQDERLGRGSAGSPVPGLAAELRRLLRFGIFGQVLSGGGPDATVLRLLWTEEGAGEHLGRPWRGTIAWCEAADVVTRLTRRGAEIGGASVHEGYWVDVDAARALHRNWEELRARFDRPEGAARLARALSVRGPLRFEPRARADELDPLGENERLALAVMAERASGEEHLGAVHLDELLELFTLHEEGHLCDRARFYPLGEHWLDILFFAAQSGFDPQRIARRLEYRAELVALCAAPDPRLVLAGLLHVGRGPEGSGPTQHSSAYQQILGDLVAELEHRIEADPLQFPRIDLRRELLYQLHRVDPETLRAAALEVAAREGLVVVAGNP
jgi:hypothetical protein